MTGRAPRARLMLVAGANGSGKSTLTARLSQRFGPRIGVVLDPDAVTRSLEPAQPSRVAVAAGRHVLRELSRLIARRERFVYETTMADRRRHLDLIAEARGSGFEVLILYIGLRRPDLSRQRVQARAQTGGHDVPPEDVVRRYARSLANLPEALRAVDRALIYDNSGRTLRRVARVDAGRVRFSSGEGWWSAALEALEREP